MGRRRISIEKIQKKEALNVAFSKRRTGVFKKAEKLCRLCGAEIAIIVFSPGNKPYVFGYPNAEAVIDRFSGCDADSNSYALAPAGEPVDEEVDRQCSEVSGAKGAQEEVGRLWWEAAIQGMELNELEQFNDSLGELRRKMVVRAAELLSMDIESCVGSSSTASVELVKSEQ